MRNKDRGYKNLKTDKNNINMFLWNNIITKKHLIISSLIVSLILMTSMIENVGALAGHISKKEIIYIIDMKDENILPRYSSSYERTNYKDVTDTVRGLEMTASVKLRVVINVNEATGIITSYSGPYLESIRMYAGPYIVRLEDISTSQRLSSSKRTLYCEGSFRIYAETYLGMDIHRSKLFTIDLNASI